MIRPSTLRLIEDAHRYSTVYRNSLANHLPMALVALDGMQASDAEIARFRQTYERQLEPLRDEERRRIDAFREAIARDGGAEVVRRSSPRLAAGVSAAAFHGAIRTAYALEAGSDAELAHALAYWDMAYATLGCGAVPQGTESPLEVLAAISRDPAQAGRKPQGPGISARMAAVAREGRLDAYVERLDPAALERGALASALIRAYAATGDFTLLHGVTGCHAFGVLAPHFDDPREALRQLWVAAVAAYMSCGSPPLDEEAPSCGQELDWPQVHRAAAQRDDEHDVKLAYSCWREWQRSGEDLYRRAASARLRPSDVQSSPRGGHPRGEGALS